VISKGVEIDLTLRPVRNFTVTGGLTYARTRYAKDLAGSSDPLTGDNSLQPTLFLLPGSQLSNAPKIVVTSSAGWTPQIGSDLRGLIYADIRYTGAINTGSDLFAEKRQEGVATVNARIGLGKGNGRWSVELWAQNLFDENYSQIDFSMPLQGGGVGQVPGTAAAVQRFGTTSTQLFGGLLGEPRTWGLTIKTRF